MESSDFDRGGPRLLWTWWPVPAALALVALLWGLANAAELAAYVLDGWRDHRATLLGWVRDYPVAAVLAVFALHTLLAMLALPGASLLMLVAGAGFGALPGTLLCLTACTVGASLSMLAARHFLQALVRRRLGERLAKLDRRIAADGAAYLFSLRLLPIVPFAVVNVAAGLSTMKAWTFTWVSFVGMLAGTFVYVNAGTQLARVEAAGDIYTPRVLLSLAALAVVPWLAKFILNAWQRRGGARA